jgi:hypothetical protein
MTEAGKRLYRRIFDANETCLPFEVDDDIAAIEAEAVAAALTALRARVEELWNYPRARGDDAGWDQALDAVLAAIDEAMPK